MKLRPRITVQFEITGEESEGLLVSMKLIEKVLEEHLLERAKDLLMELIPGLEEIEEDEI